MNWETFKTLTKEQREEYKFKFYDRPRPSVYPILTLALIYMMGIIISIFVIYLITTSTNEKLIALQDGIQNLISTSIQISNVVWALIAFYIIYDAGNITSYIIREYWWRKKNHIKYKYSSWVERVWSWFRWIIK